MNIEAKEGIKISSILSEQPACSAVSQAGQIGQMVGRKVVEVVGPSLLSQANLREAIAAVGNISMGGAIGLGVVAPVLSPFITPIAAYASGLAVSYGITLAGNLIYNALTKPEDRAAPLPTKESKGFFESVMPSMIGNLMMKGASIAAQNSPVGRIVTQIVIPVAAPLFADALTKGGGMAIDTVNDLAKKILKT